EAVAQAVPDREREEADPLVEPDVPSAPDPLSEGHLDRKKLGLVEQWNAVEARKPRPHVLRVQEKDCGEAIGKRPPEPVHDPAVEEAPVRKRVDEEKPDLTLGGATHRKDDATGSSRRETAPSIHSKRVPDRASDTSSRFSTRSAIEPGLFTNSDSSSTDRSTCRNSRMRASRSSRRWA